MNARGVFLCAPMSATPAPPPHFFYCLCLCLSWLLLSPASVCAAMKYETSKCAAQKKLREKKAKKVSKNEKEEKQEYEICGK